MGPWLLPIVGVLFFAIGFFSVILARKRLRHARALGQPAIWYKNLGLLTGFEYMLLGIIVFLNVSNSNGWVPDPLKSTFAIFYTGILFLAIVFLLAVVFIGLRQPRQKAQATQATSTIEADTDRRPPQEQAAEVQRKRERRQKAAAARRRHTGRA